MLGVGAAFAGHGLIQIVQARRRARREPIDADAGEEGGAVMSRVVVDPVTRIEGHLRIEAEVDGGAVRDAWSSSTMFRGIEIILKGRDPRDAWAFTQRICGVCTTVHAIASIRAVENAIGAAPPPNARLLRNLIIGAQCVQDHVIHFYHLHALDWVDIVSALSADPGQDLVAGRSRSRTGRCRARSTSRACAIASRRFVERGQLGPFANAYWGHPAYRLPPEANLMAVAHYLEALDWQREFIKMHAVLGGKNPHLQSFLVGGMATPVDPDSQAALNAGTIAQLQAARREGARLRRRASTFPTCWRSPRSTRTGPATAGASATTSSYGEYPDDDDARRRRCSCRAASSAAATSSKVEPFDPGQGHRVRHALLVRLRSRATTRRCTRSKGETQPELHRARRRRTSGSTPTRSTRG